LFIFRAVYTHFLHLDDTCRNSDNDGDRLQILKEDGNDEEDDEDEYADKDDDDDEYEDEFKEELEEEEENDLGKQDDDSNGDEEETYNEQAAERISSAQSVVQDDEEEEQDLVDLVVQTLVKVTELDREMTVETMKLCEMHEMASDEGQEMDISLDWLDSPDVMDLAEALHTELFPRSKLLVQVKKVSGLPQGFGRLEKKYNLMVKVSFCGSYYNTLVVEKATEPEFGETFMWTGGKFSEDSEIRCVVLDVRDATRTNLIGTCDIPLSLAAEDADNWLEETIEILDEDGEFTGYLHIDMKYSPLRVVPGQPPPLV
jgi:hypothetical protein